MISLSLVYQAEAANLIVNGDFESGNTGFETQYDPACPNPIGGGCYRVVTNANSTHPVFTLAADHTSGVGLMLVANGAPASSYVWQQTINVVASTHYLFTGYASSVYNTDPSPANLRIQVDVTADCATASSFQDVGIINAVPAISWEVNYATILTPTTTTQICIRTLNDNIVGNGNDFALDDFSLDTDARIPVTVDDTGSTIGTNSVSVSILNNDVAGTEAIDVTSIDLDPGVSGIQTTHTVLGIGTFLVVGAEVVFTPSVPYVGGANVDYRVTTVNGIPSNVSTIAIVVSAPVAVPTFNQWALILLIGGIILINHRRKSKKKRKKRHP